MTSCLLSPLWMGLESGWARTVRDRAATATPGPGRERCATPGVRVTESEPRNRVRVVVAAAIVVSLLLSVWVIYAVRTRQYLVLEQSPWSVVMGVFLTFNAVFLGTRAVRAQGWPHDLRLIF